MHLDDAVGRILEAVDASVLKNETLIVLVIARTLLKIMIDGIPMISVQRVAYLVTIFLFEEKKARFMREAFACRLRFGGQVSSHRERSQRLVASSTGSPRYVRLLE